MQVGLQMTKTKRTAAGIPTWSPTVVLICRSTACVWQSGRDAQFSADCGRGHIIPQIDSANEAKEEYAKCYAIDVPKVTTTTSRLYGRKKKRKKTKPDCPRR
ncbi:hypothetical protein E4T50_11240 [Aureobasidium sp. EXF-12298]|nr:hypothetical protein E4T50_11240 [Aureobasidium sp. EXF-12298]KAI4755242.1 hypothetical protein E4T51_11656 [Aureobasidium sp. EXF-12344]KAI4772201.1 hypothetical protein E4T52_12803 [Aureobasidium sp. EXF-3400]